ncbi:hypothetical protein [Photobacterium atrarenae]|uniref:Uncharacterized protein n=1 Tax=Photobacterium atrarenae TaxID=865757 RepID=A0ABY5GMY1_9GAMM|nr:hypothetical protein [Photobacterium atrarenae]UTV30683.1 hypothetical protein NNL38_19165 [Photobacterium atrarenae]
MDFVSCSFQCGHESIVFHSAVQAIGYLDRKQDDEAEVSAAIDVKVGKKVVTYKFERLEEALESIMNL